MKEQILSQDALKDGVFLFSTTLFNCGIIHGFLGKKFSSMESLSDLFKSTRFISSTQVHGNEVWTLPKNIDSLSDSYQPPHADAIIFSSTILSSHSRLVFIKTADCVPIIFYSSTHRALVHAGWRGLANGVIGKALKHFNLNSNLIALIGPCACQKCYEVGEEVISAIMPPPIYSSGEKNRFNLNLAKTAQEQIYRYCPKATIVLTDLCTICSNEMHSYRRDRENSGRNYSFIYIPAS